MPKDGEWSEALMKFIRNSDVHLMESSEKIILNYERELLPCESLGEMFDVLGKRGCFKSQSFGLK